MFFILSPRLFPFSHRNLLFLISDTFTASPGEREKRGDNLNIQHLAEWACEVVERDSMTLEAENGVSTWWWAWMKVRGRQKKNFSKNDSFYDYFLGFSRCVRIIIERESQKSNLWLGEGLNVRLWVKIILIFFLKKFHQNFQMTPSHHHKFLWMNILEWLHQTNHSPLLLSLAQNNNIFFRISSTSREQEEP